jgi:hypothetical protein
MSPETSAFERHYRIGELAELWGIGRETVRLLVKDEPGVIKIRLGRKRSQTLYAVPASVAARIHTRLSTLQPKAGKVGQRGGTSATP